MSNRENFLTDHAPVILIIIGVLSIFVGWHTNQYGVVFSGVGLLVVGGLLGIFLGFRLR